MRDNLRNYTAYAPGVFNNHQCFSDFYDLVFNRCLSVLLDCKEKETVLHVHIAV